MKLMRIVLTMLCLALLLCGCSREAKVVGTWVSCGTPDIKGSDFAFKRADQWTFTEEGTALVTVDGETTEYGYSLSDDTLTLNGETISYGVRYKLKGDTFSIYTGGGGYADFERVEE